MSRSTRRRRFNSFGDGITPNVNLLNTLSETFDSSMLVPPISSYIDFIGDECLSGVVSFDTRLSRSTYLVHFIEKIRHKL